MATQIIALLDNQLVNLTTLSSLLEQELHLISGRDADQLTQLLNEKSALLETIATADQKIAQAYASLSDEAKQNAELQDKIAKARSVVEDCKYRTSVNEKAVEQGQLKIAHLRNVLTEARAKESMTYDKSGQTTGGTLGKGISA